MFPPPPAVAKIQVLQMDLATLKDGVEVNDSIVDFFLMYISQSLDQDLLDSIHVFSSFFYTRLSTRVQTGETFVLPGPDERFVKASQFTRRVDIFKKKFIFIPVCRSGHWFLSLIYNLPTLTSRRRKDDGCTVVPILMIDSIVYGPDRKNFTCSPSSREQEANIIRSFIEYEWRAKMSECPSPTPHFTSKTMPVLYPKVPQQENGYDCGVFVMLFFEEFSRRKFPVSELLSDKILLWYNQASAFHLRERVKGILLATG